MMDIYSVYMCLAIFLHTLITKKNGKIYIANRDKVYPILMGIQLFLIAALRNTSVGIDSLQYSRHYELIQFVNISDIIHYADEPLFYYFIKILSIISTNYQLMFAAVGAIYAFAISRFIYKYSSDKMVSFVMLIPMMYFFFSLTGLRQTISISILLVSIDYIIDRKPIKFFFLIMLAYFIHKSAVLFSFSYLLNSKSINKVRIVLYIVLMPIIYILRHFIVNIIKFFIYSHYEFNFTESAGGWTTLIVYILILFASLIFKKEMVKKDNRLPLFFNMMYIGALIQMFVPLQPNVFRVSMYYNISSIILIPGILKTQEDKVSKLIAYSAFFILMGIQYYIFTYNAAGANPYNFFWES